MRSGAVGCYLSALALASACHNDTTVAPNSAGPASRMQIISGDLQSDTVGRELPQALLVRVTDSNGIAVKGQIVNFRVIAGGGAVFAGAAITNDSGQARERWTLGTVARDTQLCAL